MEGDTKRLLTLTLLALASLVSAANLTGFGSSFVSLLSTKMFAEYKADAVNYQSVGSGSGQKQLHDRVVDFAGTDVPIPAADIAGYPGKVLTVPTTMGSHDDGRGSARVQRAGRHGRAEGQR